MPIYDFRCKRCDEEFELIVRSGTSCLCPHCGSDALQKLLSAPALPGRTKAIIAGARRQAAREGHFSNYAPGERPRRK